jgi:hypothetical protein
MQRAKGDREALLAASKFVSDPAMRNGLLLQAGLWQVRRRGRICRHALQ